MSIINIYEPKTFNLIPVPNYLEDTYYNGIGLTPPMGWNSFNCFNLYIDENKIIDMAKAIKNSGLADVGYVYINLDDSWQSSSRDIDGKLQADIKKFPSGIKNLVKTINDLGLKVGLYSCNGTFTRGKYLGSLNHEYIDAQTFADWGIDYLKYDFCFNIPIQTNCPDISKIYIKNKDNLIITSLTSENAKLYQNAKIANYNASTTIPYITGLSAKGGFAIFENIIAPSTETYELSVHYTGSGYFELAINYGENIYATTVAPSSEKSNYAIATMNIKLNKGINTIIISNPIDSIKESSIRQFLKMGNALKEATNQKAKFTDKTLKEIYFSICDCGENCPWEWGKLASNCWRTTYDIADDWNTIMGIYNTNITLYAHAVQGGFNDSDILQVGNDNLTYEENKSHFTLWCMMSSPLILGNDIRTFINSDGSINSSNPIYTIITNKDLISINQDSKCIQSRIFKTERNVDILIKPLFNNDLAICFFNKGTSSQASNVNILDIIKEPYVTLSKLTVYKIFDLWDKTIISSTDNINVTIPPHGVKVYRIGNHLLGELYRNQNFFLNIHWILEISSLIKITASFINTGKETINNINLTLQVPSGFSATPLITNIETLLSGKTFTAQWNLTTPLTKGDYTIIANATFKYSSSLASQTISTSKTIKLLSTPKAGDSLADVDFISSTTDYDTIKPNKSINGNPLTINGKVYTSGIGTHANSEIKIFTGGKSLQFCAIVGIDDEVNGGNPLIGFPSAVFQVWGDNEKLYDSGILRYKQNDSIFLDLTTYKIITLKSLDAKDGNFFDHCNWVNSFFKSNTQCNLN